MDNEEREESINELYSKMHEAKKHMNYSKYVIYRRKILSEVSELENTMTDEEFEAMMESRSEIDTSRC